jgi:hypothetical protein
MKPTTRPFSSVGTTPYRRRAAVAVEGQERAHVEIGQHVAVDDDEPLVHAGVAGREGNGSAGVERLRLDGVGEPDIGAPAIGIGGEEGVGPVAEREHDLVDPVLGEVRHDPLDHGPARDRQHVLGRGEGQRPEAGALTSDQDHGLHYFAVVDVVLAGAVVVAPVVVEVDPGTVVAGAPAVVVGVVVVGVVAATSLRCSRL